MLRENNAGVTLAKGFKASGIKAGIKKSGKDDLAIIYSEVPATVAGVFTQNLVAAAPVWVSKAVAQNGVGQAIVANAGCANACTGEIGFANAKKMAELTAKELKVKAEEVFVASTGVIGVNLPMDKVESGIKKAATALDDNGSIAAGKAIMTTDTINKEIAVTFTIGDKKVTLGGMCKGSGMIHPNMCTMLAFLTTDLAISKELLQEALSEDIKDTYNMISVDGDTSTNDTVLLFANGLAGNEEIREKNLDYEEFKKNGFEIEHMGDYDLTLENR